MVRGHTDTELWVWLVNSHSYCMSMACHWRCFIHFAALSSKHIFSLGINTNSTKKYIILDIEPWPNFQPIILYFPSFLSLMTRLLRRRWWQILIWRRWQTLFRRRRHSVYNLRGVRFYDIPDRLFIGLGAGQCLRWNWVKWLILSGWFK